MGTGTGCTAGIYGRKIMKLELTITPEELTEAIMLFKEAFQTEESPKPEPETVYGTAVGTAIKEALEKSTLGGKKEAPKTQPKQSGGRKKLPRDEIKGMYDAGFSTKEIAEKLGASEGTIKHILRTDIGVVKVPLDLANVRACLAAGKDIEWLVVEFGERYRDEIVEYVKELEEKKS